jgi:hypothetical protein
MLLLQRAGVEKNPGPTHKTKTIHKLVTPSIMVPITKGIVTSKSSSIKQLRNVGQGRLALR